jgi:hypothetical protein
MSHPGWEEEEEEADLYPLDEDRSSYRFRGVLKRDRRKIVKQKSL